MEQKAFRFELQALVFVALCVASLALLDALLLRLPTRFSELLPDAPPGLAKLRGAGEGVLYLGDSTVFTTKKRAAHGLAQALAREISLPVHSVARPGLAVDSFLAQLHYVAAAGVRPAAVLIAINLHSFGSIWESLPSVRFGRFNAAYVRPLEARALAVFKHRFGRPEAFEPDARWAELIGEGGEAAAEPLDPSLLQGRSPDHLRRRCVANYASDVERSQGLPVLDELLGFVVAQELPVLIYLTPLGLERIQQCMGAERVRDVRRNLDVLRGRLRGSGLAWLDLSGSLTSRDFAPPDFIPHEHLSRSGLTATAAALARALEPILGGARDADR